MVVHVSRSSRPFIGDEDREVVERKGIGHPDTLADALANEISRDYSRYCLDTFGRMAHHWFDKVLLLGGESHVEFGHGSIIQPMTVQVAGKATLRVGRDEIPIAELAANASRRVLEGTLYEFNFDRDCRVVLSLNDNVGAGRTSNRYRPSTAEELPTLGDQLIANDTVNCTGFYGLSRLERLVLDVEGYLNGVDFKRVCPWTGTDIKMIGVREGKFVRLIVRLPFIASLVTDRTDYLEKKEVARANLRQFLSELQEAEVELLINSDDDLGLSYLTASGTVADTGDHGVVGRGNRANGLITPGRPMNIEAPAGKNPVDHVGKLYTELTARLARQAHASTARDFSITLVTERGNDLRKPAACLVEYFGDALSDNDCEQVARSIETDIGAVSDLGSEFIDAKTWLTG